MRKLAIGLVALGAFVLTFGVMARVWVYPSVAVIPALDVRLDVGTATGEDPTYFDVPTLSQKTGPIDSSFVFRVDGKASSAASADLGHAVTVIQSYACSDPAGGDCTHDRYPLTGTLTMSAVDRSSGEFLAWKGNSVETGGTHSDGVTFAGYSFKFPFNAQQSTYPYWNQDTGHAVDAVFDSSVDLDGMTVYKYVATLPATASGTVELPGSLVGSPASTVTGDRVYSSTTALFVEPETGVIVGTDAQLDNYITVAGARALTATKGHFFNDQASIAAAAAKWRTTAMELKALRLWAPIVGVVVGIALFVTAGVLLWRDRRRRAPRPEAASPTQSNTVMTGV